MPIAARPVMLVATLALGSFALGAVTTAQTTPVPEPRQTLQPAPVSGADGSLPLASTVTFPTDDAIAAPTF